MRLLSQYPLNLYCHPMLMVMALLIQMLTAQGKKVQLVVPLILMVMA